MYYIQGADQKEYGPISADQLRQWISENRLNRFSPARAEGDTLWKTLGDFPEFADILGASVPPMSAQVTSAPGTGGTSNTPSGSRMRPTPGVSEAIVEEKLRIPAFGLLATGILGILRSMTEIVLGLFLGSWPKDMFRGLPPEMDRFLKGYMESGQTWATPMGVLTGVLSLVVLLGGIRMLQRRSYGLAMTGAIVSMLPCSCCCCLGLPFGIWALVVLSNPEVKNSFR